jgi:hypothetical protein
MRDWLYAASERSVLRRALISCVLVGVLLTAVNHGPQLARGELDAGLAAQVGLTMLVPFVVSVVSSVAAIRDRDSRA